MDTQEWFCMAANVHPLEGNPAVFLFKTRGFPAPSRGGCGRFIAILAISLLFGRRCP